MEVRYGDPAAGPTVRGEHYPIAERSREAFDAKIAEIMALPGYKAWRVAPSKRREYSHEIDGQATVWCARIIVFERPVDLAPVVWPPEGEEDGTR